ncbi:LpxI family protein [Jiella sp. M17.18]|uniref:LpxI family protein n=1 Tax=Jiella sp. M17.18 TaxID=3234247 RepID=UPI0034DE36B6
MEPEAHGQPIGIVSGGGSLPRIVAEGARAKGWRPVMVLLADARPADWTGFDGRSFPWGRAGDAIDHLKRSGVRHVVFAGTVSQRPDFRALIPSFRTLIRLPDALRIVRGGDDRLLRTLGRYLERQGFQMLAVQDIVPALIAPEGVLGGVSPDPMQARALRVADEAARMLGSLDIGQAVVASPERVVAVEAVEGTREMLQRVADLRARKRLHRSERCVLVKTVKPQQDLRFDLPSIGAATIAEAAAAGIGAIGLTAGRSLILGIDEVVAAADAAAIALVGLPDRAVTGPAEDGASGR